jgi:hypothetical protein
MRFAAFCFAGKFFCRLPQIAAKQIILVNNVTVHGNLGDRF